ncbi:EFR1 family ferrodoxin [Dehalobacter sp. DCM]|uniref:EFR1 family ferrodoxin n=1 Tax=Dehalobacter sp. DCM TaxID=2907827 RepID=UPI00308204F3|nr:EFR1 family ferrodoxin [Dehalobacter sp. DCM]
MEYKLNILYFSATGNTEKVVKTIAHGMGVNCKEYTVSLPASRVKDIIFGDKDIVIVGVPVYAGRVPSFLSDYFTRVKGNNTPAVFVVVYGNRHYDDALLELKNIFEDNGFIGIAAGAFIGEHSYSEKVATGRPDSEDLQLAAEFGNIIIEKLSAMEIAGNRELEVKGNFPYRNGMPKLTAVPVTGSECNLCGLCAQFCPMEAISLINYRDIDNEKCIVCCSCIKRCSVRAKSIDHEFINKIRQLLIENFTAVRQIPELFF